MSEDSKRERGWLGELRAALDGPLLWLGVVIGVASGVSAIVRLFDVGLVGLLQDFVQFYRGLLSPFYDWVNLLPFHVPPLAVDLFAVYGTLVGMGVRAAALRPRLSLDDHVGAIRNLEDLNRSVFRDRAEGMLGDTDELATAFVNTAHQNWRGHLTVAAWLRCFLLVPILSLEPVTRFLQGISAEREIGFESAQARFNQLLFSGFAAFVSLPAGWVSAHADRVAIDLPACGHHGDVEAIAIGASAALGQAQP